MNELRLNQMFGENTIRTIVTLQEVWFVLKDVCDTLGINNSRMVFNRLDDDEKGVSKTDTLGGEQEVQICNEFGLYKVILRSNSQQAKQFQRWVTHEVLPSIRKQGFYSLMSDDDLIEFLKERQRNNPKALDAIDKQAIKRSLLEEDRSERIKQIETLWNRHFTDHDPAVQSYGNLLDPLFEICRGDQALYHKYRDKFEKALNRESKGWLIPAWEG